MALREVLEKILEAEAQGKRIVESAKAEAERIDLQGRKEADQIRARVDAESRVEAERILEAIVQSAEQEKDESLVRAKDEIDTAILLDEPTRQRAVDAVVRCVCQAETDGR